MKHCWLACWLSLLQSPYLCGSQHSTENIAKKYIKQLRNTDIEAFEAVWLQNWRSNKTGRITAFEERLLSAALFTVSIRKLRGSTVDEAFEDLKKHRQDIATSVEVLTNLVELEPDTVLPLIIEACKREAKRREPRKDRRNELRPHWQRLRNLLFALGQGRNAKSLAYVEELLDHKADHVRLAAVELVLKKLPTEGSMKLMAGILESKSKKDRSIIPAAIDAIGIVADGNPSLRKTETAKRVSAKIYEILLDAIAKGNTETQNACVRSLGKLRYALAALQIAVLLETGFMKETTDNMDALIAIGQPGILSVLGVMGKRKNPDSTKPLSASIRRHERKHQVKWVTAAERCRAVLRRISGKDFGYDVDAWELWLKKASDD